MGKANICYQGMFYALLSTLFSFAGGAVAGMVSKASFLHGAVISEAATNGRGTKGQIWISREERPFPDPLPCSRIKVSLSAHLFILLLFNLSSVLFPLP